MNNHLLTLPASSHEHLFNGTVSVRPSVRPSVRMSVCLSRRSIAVATLLAAALSRPHRYLAAAQQRAGSVNVVTRGGSMPTCQFTNTIRYNESIDSARLVSRRAESEARTIARGKDGEARV